MKNKLITLLAMIGSMHLFSQVGINTPNPQGILNVDGAKDNPITGVPTSIQQLNDFTITKTGNVGIGKTFPAEKVDIEGNIQFNGTLKPNGITGTSGQVLTSQGAASPPTWVTSSIVPVVATVKSGEAMSFASGSTYKLKFDTVEQDTWSGVNIDNDEIKINQEGDYLVQAQFGFNGSEITTSGLVITLKKGTTEVQKMQAPAGGINNTYINLVGVHHFSANDVITISGFQNTGSTHSWNPAYFRFSIAKL